MTALTRLRRLFTEIIREAEVNPDFAERLDRILLEEPARSRPQIEAQIERRGRPHRRTPGVLDPFEVYQRGGEADLRQRLSALDLEQLRDIVAEHGMDPSKLAMKWKSRERVVDLVVQTVASRLRKGDAFRTYPAVSRSHGET